MDMARQSQHSGVSEGEGESECDSTDTANDR